MLEHGAGHPREELEDEREELARRFREKYHSHHPSGEVERSNVAPYFIGVFDTVAALGANGLRRVITQSIIYGGMAFLTLLVGFIPAIVGSFFMHRWANLPFWPGVLGIEALALIGGIAWLLHRQRTQVRKTITDFPNKGDHHTHYARWEGVYFNRLLSRFVTYARSANAIDETRADFDRVPWGPTRRGVDETAGHKTLRQVFFAGNHSDIGGSYAEAESRLSDNALVWMLEEAVKVPEGLKVGPVFVNGDKMPGTGEGGLGLYTYPADDGIQHCEVAAMRDYLDALKPRWLSWLLRNWNCAVKIRDLPPGAELHSSVVRRLALPGVQQTSGFGCYRPEMLREIAELKKYYSPGLSGTIKQ